MTGTGNYIVADTVRLLAELGDTPDAVARTLTAADCTGLRRSCCRCPIARWLARYNIPVSAVGCTAADVTTGPDGYAEVRLPVAVALFIRAFDDGDWPELVAES